MTAPIPEPESWWKHRERLLNLPARAVFLPVTRRACKDGCGREIVQFTYPAAPGRSKQPYGRWARCHCCAAERSLWWLGRQR